MAYQSRRNRGYSDEDALNTSSQKKMAEKQASQKAFKTAAKGAGTYFGGAIGGKAVDMASNTKAGQKIIEKGGKNLERMRLGKAAKKLDDQGVIDDADQAIDMLGKKNKANGGGKKALPSFDSKKEGEKEPEKEQKVEISGSTPSPDSDSNSEDNSDSEKKKKNKGDFFGNADKKKVIAIILSLLGILLFFILIFVIVGSVVSYISDFDDAFGLSFALGEENSDEDFKAIEEDQEEFFKRIEDVKVEYEANGKIFDPISVVAVYNVLVEKGANIDYDDMTKNKIKKIVDSMFDNSFYSEETFKNNLVSSILPTYLPRLTTGDYKDIADDVVEYVTEYNELAEREFDYGGACAGSGVCNYNIKGFYIKGKGNIDEKLNLTNVYVRLMQCGSANGHNYGGIFGKPLEGEELVPFEKYILGVAYQEIGASAPKEAIKAQMVAARSYILARHTDMGGWRTIKKEGEKWVIQAASCTQDQVYCDPDRGCSSTDGQWGQIHSGLNYNKGFVKNPMPQDSPLRKYASETRGEVLVNKQGYVIYSGYMSDEQNTFSSLANSGKDYKQILMQVYNQGSRNYGAYDIQKANCDNGENCGTISTGPFANWKQCGAPWSNITMGSGRETICSVGCLTTSISMLIAKSGVKTNVNNFNPGTFVQHLNKNGGFVQGANLVWGSVSTVAPTFKHEGSVDVSGMSREQKLNSIKSLVSQPSIYVVAEVKGNTGQHWVAIDSVSGNTINMMDPGSKATNMWKQYNWNNTSTLHYFRAG